MELKIPVVSGQDRSAVLDKTDHVGYNKRNIKLIRLWKTLYDYMSYKESFPSDHFPIFLIGVYGISAVTILVFLLVLMFLQYIGVL